MSCRVFRHVAFAVAAVVFGALALPANAADGPAVKFVKALYALPDKWADVVGTGTTTTKYLTDDFAAAVEENQKYSDDLEYAVDYDPLVQGQDFRLTDMKVVAEKSSDDAAVVRASFKNFDQATIVRFSLVKAGDRWKLADLFNGEGESLLEEYRTLNIAGRAVKAGN